MVACEGSRNIVAWMHEVAAHFLDRCPQAEPTVTSSYFQQAVDIKAKAITFYVLADSGQSQHSPGQLGLSTTDHSLVSELRVGAMANIAMDALRERVTQLEKLVGVDESDEEVTLVDSLDAMLNPIESHKLAHEAHITQTEAKFTEMVADVTKLLDVIKGRVSNMESDFLLVKRAFLCCSDGFENRVNKKVLESKTFGGARNAKELENFLWTGGELDRRMKFIQRLRLAVAAADGLVDFKLINKSNSSESNSLKSKDKNKKKEEKKAGSKKWEKGQKSKSVENDKQQDKGNFSKGCFICLGPHRARDCPKRGKLNAICLDEGKGGESRPCQPFTIAERDSCRQGFALATIRFDVH
ncbi:hypothetical protein Vadar_018465 [Vaccinium darrowii]|uniref:Uncharacterized protein n=1 Tax=Vaccinium darrowii TaxID=229202 RepID=A0ACB7XAX1_9ERIC|nr:hypothetical protein Vadar_018465 [Vaccinium darrowii]